MSRYVVVANPAARGGAAELAEKVASTLGTGTVQLATRGTASGALGTAPALAAEIGELLEGGGVELVVSVGGDGTAREVAEALARALGTWPAGGPAPATSVPLHIVPGGTGNSVYRELWSDRPWEETLEIAAQGRAGRAEVDLLRIVEADRAVLLGASTGFFRWTLDASSHHPTKTGRELYTAAAAEVAGTLEPYQGRVRVDGELLVEGPIVLCAIGGTKHRAGTIPVLPAAQVDDGLLDVCVVSVPTREELFALMGDVAAGTHVGRPGVHYAQGRRLEIEADGVPLPFEHDGDAWAGSESHLTLEVVEHAVPLTKE